MDKACRPPPGAATRHLRRWLNQWQMTDFLNLHPNPNTRTRHLMAETRDLNIGTPANHPVSGLPLSWHLLPWVGRVLRTRRTTDGSENRPYLALSVSFRPFSPPCSPLRCPQLSPQLCLPALTISP